MSAGLKKEKDWSFSGVSRLGPLPPLLEEDYEDDMYDDQRATGGVSPSSSSAMGEYSGGMGGAGCSSSTASLRARHEVGFFYHLSSADINLFL